MSRENVELVRRIYRVGSIDIAAIWGDDEAAERTIAAVEPLVHPDFEFEFAGQALLTDLRGPYRGLRGFRDAMRKWVEAYPQWHSELIELIDAGGDQVLALTRYHGRSVSGVELEVDAAEISTIRDGQIVRLRSFLDRDAAAEAAGVDPESFER